MQFLSYKMTCPLSITIFCKKTSCSRVCQFLLLTSTCHSPATCWFTFKRWNIAAKRFSRNPCIFLSLEFLFLVRRPSTWRKNVLQFRFSLSIKSDPTLGWQRASIQMATSNECIRAIASRSCVINRHFLVNLFRRGRGADGRRGTRQCRPRNFRFV